MASSGWWTKDTVAVVTGANKGIGFEIAKQLALHGLTVVITARDQQRGLKALAQLQDLTRSASSNIVFHLLDVNNPESVLDCATWLSKQFKGVDILVNNAGVATSLDSSYEKARLVLDTNYTGVKRVTEALLPYMKASVAGARIVNVSSALGQIQMLSPSLQPEVENLETLSEEKIDFFVNRFLHDAKEGVLGNKGWISGEYSDYPAYCVSKVVLNAYSRVLAKKLQDQSDGEKIYVNCINPGYCKTDLNNNQGHLTPAEGADTAVWLALLDPPIPNGEFFSQRKPLQF